MDQDYTSKLSEEDKKWLSDFNDQYYSGRTSKEHDHALLTKDELRVVQREAKKRRESSYMAYSEDRQVDLKTIKDERGMFELKMVQKFLEDMGVAGEEYSQYAECFDSMFRGRFGQLSKKEGHE